MTYIDLPGFTRVPLDRSSLRLPRALELFDAITSVASFELLGLQRSHADHGAELLVVELACDEVPTRNPVGIQYRERLGIVVYKGSLSIPKVYPLRADFPAVSHRNSPAPGFPPDLCLYFEPARAVLRTWTSAKFLKRVEWWMQATASSTLHAADQPVERLFFMTPYELVLPFDFHARRNAGAKFYLAQGTARPDGGLTLFGYFNAAATQSGAPKPFCGLLEAQVPPVVHGTVESSPHTLGDLHDLLLQKGFDLRAHLILQFAGLVPQGGMAADASNQLTVLLLTVPLVRTLDGAIESLQQQAFVMLSGILPVGEALGGLFKLDGKYYNDVQIGQDQAAGGAWRSIEIDAVDVMFQNDRASARRQSGIKDEGPSGALIGAGSLGSAIYNLWIRAGWGAWTVIDKDHIKPHNPVRHTAGFDQVGMTKVDTAMALAHHVGVGGTLIAGIEADAVECASKEFNDTLANAQLVVDISTTLDYPRRASIHPAWARHASLFVTPSGKDGVMLLEDAARTMPLLTLEAQYYRALISSEWGASHLDGNLGTYWSGAGCRDISVALPYSRVLAHAATMAEQIMQHAKQPEPLIRVWMRDPDSGSVMAHAVPVAPVTTHTIGEFTAYIDQALQYKLHQLRSASLPRETGGVLLGYWDFNVRVLVIVDALAAPADSESSPDSFVRGTQGLAQAVAEASRRTGGVVGYVGEWHSHPAGVPAKPSTDDLAQVAVLAAQMAQDGLPIATLIVGQGEMTFLSGKAQ